MKHILEFIMPEDKEDLYLAQYGHLYSFVLDDLENWLREKYKYKNEVNITIEEVRAKIYELKNGRGVE